MMKRAHWLWVCFGFFGAWQVSAGGEVPENFRRENLVAWAIVPFDAVGRGPAERARLIRELGMRRCAYDWRVEHVPEFEDEIEAYGEEGIEYVAFWNEHEAAFELFEKHAMRPQVWKTLRTPNVEGQGARVAAAVEAMTPLAERTAAMGCPLGLYNHGGWGGEPENLVAVCEALREAGHDHVGIVYNFHHGHFHVDGFAESFDLMRPYLLCVNLNGMRDAEEVDVTVMENKIVPIGDGAHERAMIGAIIESGYDGLVGIIGHRKDEDLAVTLRANLEGLQEILEARIEYGGR
ncbi:MAG: TIM barrel protein [Verrucomicrobiota bacterium]